MIYAENIFWFRLLTSRGRHLRSSVNYFLTNHRIKLAIDYLTSRDWIVDISLYTLEFNIEAKQ
jgi:hypothetical protein